MRSARIFARMEQNLDRHFGQLIRFIPLAKPESYNEICDVTKDQTRLEITVQGVFETSYIEYKFKGVGRADAFNEIIDDYPICLIRNGLLPYDLEKGDQIQIIETGEFFQISNILPDGLARQMLELKKSAEVLT